MIQYPGFDKIAFEIGPFGRFRTRSKSTGTESCTSSHSRRAGGLARVRAKKPGSTWKPVDVDDFMFFGMLGTILGGRLGYVFFYGLSYWARGPVVSVQDHATAACRSTAA